MRLIDADALIQAADKMFENIDSPLLNHLTTYDVYSLINNAPTVEERPHGEWEEPFEHKGKKYHKCTHCHISTRLMFTDSFCPNCGADMRKEAENDK